MFFLSSEMTFSFSRFPFVDGMTIYVVPSFLRCTAPSFSAVMYAGKRPTFSESPKATTKIPSALSLTFSHSAFACALPMSPNTRSM